MTGRRSGTPWISLSLVAGLVVALAVVAPGTGAANVSAGSASLGNFARQAVAAGLTLTQADALQARVDSYLHQLGGVQVAANEIRYGNGTTLTLTLPGQQRARSLASAAADISDCPYYYFCAYKFNYGVGDRILAYYCSTWVAIPWTTTGSWVNNQSPGGWAYLLRQDKSVYYGPSMPYQVYYAFNWGPVYWIDPC